MFRSKRGSVLKELVIPLLQEARVQILVEAEVGTRPESPPKHIDFPQHARENIGFAQHAKEYINFVHHARQ